MFTSQNLLGRDINEKNLLKGEIFVKKYLSFNPVKSVICLQNSFFQEPPRSVFRNESISYLYFQTQNSPTTLAESILFHNNSNNFHQKIGNFCLGLQQSVM
ncbi:hypothetical protein WA026_005220 [Henosepilachna vigintioctopunctata]|uniref:Uncharacterized protein n=1 Tax=Henosepilachna vigintioctopunctata TaxID=420089 RepID=A0AAW1UUW5_9CUCU